MRSAAILLCMVLLMQLGGWFFLTKTIVGVGQIRHHWSNANTQPVLFVFTECQFDLISDGEAEIIHLGSFYDIQSVSRCQNKIHVTALPDGFEDGLLAFFKAFSGHSNEKSPQTKVIPLLKFVLPDTIGWMFADGIQTINFPWGHFTLPFQPVSISTPPPERFFV